MKGFCWLSAKEGISSGLHKTKTLDKGKQTADFCFYDAHLWATNSAPGTEKQLKGHMYERTPTAHCFLCCYSAELVLSYLL